MAIFNVNQNRQFYVMKAFKAKTATISDEGDLQLLDGGDNQIFFKHKGMGGLTRTDIIDVDKIRDVKITRAKAMERHTKKALIKLNDVNEGKPIPGQDYVLMVQVNNYLAPGDACVLIRTGAVHATKAMSTNVRAFYDKLAESLTKNFSKDPHPILEFEASDNGVTISGVKDQPWRLGVLSQDVVDFEIIPTTVRFDGEDMVWMETDEKSGRVKVEEDTTVTINNGKRIADLEYFCMGERGDMFRNMGWPNNIDVKMMVEPDKAYDVVDIHYAYSGDGVQVHKSEKDLTIVCSTPAEVNSLKTALTALDGVTVKEETGE